MVIDIPQYIHQCVPNIAENTMMAIIKTESKFNPLAIGLNKGVRLMYQPQNLAQAGSWVTYLEKHGYNFDVGITQVNIKNIHKYGYRAIDALDPCLNMKLGGHILQSSYIKALRKSGNKREALYKAISAYNTGNYRSGFHNGYVQKVVYNASENIPYIPTKSGKL